VEGDQRLELASNRGSIVKTLSRFQTFLKSLGSRIDGSHVDVGSEHVTTLSTKAQFPEADYLKARFLMARELVGEVEIKADRKLIQEQPDFGEPKRVDFDRLPS
jgi:hypothetical protein